MRKSMTTVILALVVAIIAVSTAGGAFAESNPNWHFKLTGVDGTLTANATYTVEVYFIPDYFPAPGQPNDGPNTLRVYSLDVGFDTNNLDFLSIAYYTHDLGGGATWQGGTLRPYNTINGTIQYVNGTVIPRFLTNVYWPDEDNHHLATITFNAKSTGTFQNLVWWEDPAADRYAIVDGIAYTSDPLILWKEDGVPVGTRDQNGTYEPYVLHLGVSETPPLDTFPRETTPAGVPYYTAVASARQALRFL
ncbi:MAG TPA: hypothetical protein VMX75_06065, partial [Spirochaetia bacterium]|nr:hypothetical protein [Spirochaetia bacterium]